MTDHGLGLLASRLTDAIRAVPLVDPKKVPWPNRVTIDGHDAMVLLGVIHEVRRHREDRETMKTYLHRAEREVKVCHRRAETIRGLLDQANVDMHVEFGAERQAREKVSSCL